jgi:hypothetical protein
MNDWIDLHALGQIVVIGLICGAGLPALFAVGLRALSMGSPQEVSAEGGPRASAVNPIGAAVAGICFAVVLGAIGWGIYLIVDGT